MSSSSATATCSERLRSRTAIGGGASAGGAATAAEPGGPPAGAAPPADAPPPISVRLRSRSLRVAVADELLTALRDVVGPDHVHLVRTT